MQHRYAAIAVLTLGAFGARLDAQQPASTYLEPQLKTGETLSDAFSRTRSYEAPGIDVKAGRDSGTATYTVLNASTNNIEMDFKYYMDGSPELKDQKAEIKDHGRTLCYGGKCSPNNENASGVLYSPFMWGEPKGMLEKGLSWDVSFTEPWELGPPGKQKVTVILADPANHLIMLQREGTGEGSLAHESKQIPVTKDGKKYVVDVIAGQAHWTGYAIFREGVVISDELLLERKVTLKSDELGTIPATERYYMLLDAMPAGSY